MSNYIGELIRKKREQSGLTQAELAKKLGYPNSQFVSIFERGLSKVPNETLGKISSVLKINPSIFINYKTSEYKKQLTEDIIMAWSRH